MDGEVQTTKKSNKYGLNHNYFEKINSPNKAYLLGFLYADGNVSKNLHYVSIDVSILDINIINFIISELYQKQPLLSYRTLKDKKYVRLCICSTKMCRDLVNLGCMPNKTFKLQFPEFIFDDVFMKDFIRGYLDGDGTVSKKGEVCIVGNISFIKKLKEYLKNKNIETSKIIKDGNIYRLSICGSKYIYEFYNYIYYSNDFFCYHRKKVRIEENLDNIIKNATHIKSSKYKYVVWDRARNKWMARYKKKYLGRFNTEEEAYKKVLLFSEKGGDL